jgi:cytochrome P450
MWRQHSAGGAERPPSPPGLPLLGSLLAARRDPLGFLLSLARDYGDITYYRIGIYTGYLVVHPDYIRHILQLNHQNYSKENYDYEMLKPVLGEGLLTSNGDHWLRQRRLIQPAFHQQHIAGLGPIVSRAAAELLEAWDAVAARGEAIDVAADMQRLTLRTIGEALFSIDIRAETDTIGGSFAVLNRETSHRLKTLLVPPLWIPTPRNLVFKRARAELDRVVYDIIANRRRGRAPQDDLLDMLVAAREQGSGEGMTDRQLRDEVMTLLLAGHETTATALTWTWYLLSKHPGAARRLRAELNKVLGGRLPAVDDLSALDYTRRVIQESMRLYPPVWIISRTAIEEDEIGGYTIPAGSVLLLSQYAMHRHPDFWENPEGFDPDRFLPERSQGRHPYAYFPFGGGPRLCIGANLAMLETQLILATLAQHYRLELLPGHPVEPEPLITLRPRHGMKMMLFRAA